MFNIIFPNEVITQLALGVYETSSTGPYDDLTNDGAPRNGYRISSHWQSVPTDRGFHEDNLKSHYDHFEMVAVREEVQRMREILKTLPARTQEVLALRMAGKTLAEIGKEIGVTRERVRQIEARGIQLARQKLIALEEKK